MATIEALLTLGEGQGIDYKKLALAGFATGGGQGALTWTDVHWAMSGLEPIERAIVYLKYNPARVTGGEMAALTNHLWLKLIGLEAKSRPDPPAATTPAQAGLIAAANAQRDTRHARTVECCLAEYMDTKLCDRCRTSGAKYPGKVAENVPGVGLVWTTCDKCNGRQWVPWSDNMRAARCSGNRAMWKPRYETNYLTLLDECSELYRTGSTLFKDRLFGAAPLEPTLQARA